MNKLLKGEIQHDVSLADHTSWKVGGLAKRLYQPASIDDLQNFMQQQSVDESLLWLGLGSNVLIADEGFAGTVILTLHGLNNLEIKEECIVRTEAGVPCATMARFCARSSLTGAEFLAGVPGTIGGALKMNAGAFGGETWEHVIAVETIDRAGQLHMRYPNEFSVAYREVKMPADEWFIAGYFHLKPGDKQSSFDAIRVLLDKRALTQPTGVPSCGSVFRNPVGDYAARLIEASGLKGYRIGGATVSTKHANFIINEGDAKANDIEQLIQYVEQTVAAKYGVQLQREVQIIR